MPNRFDDDRRKRIAALRKRLSGGPEGKTLAAFADILFGHAAGEDLVEYDAEALAGISRDAFAFFRRRDEPTMVRVADVPGTDLKGRTHSAIEVLTGNRPFIFDSILGELQASGHAVRLVVHPILEVRRNLSW